MPVPDYQMLMHPVLELHTDGAEHAMNAVVKAMADMFGLTSDEHTQLLASGRSTLISNRVNWAIAYLVHAAALQRPRRAHTMITKRGNDLIATAASIDVKALEKFAEFRAFRARKRIKADATSQVASERNESPPGEAIPELVAEAHAVLAIELVERQREASPEFFEPCVLQLLVKMSYGGDGESEQLGGPHGGLDGLVWEDPLGFGEIYTQAKRYKADQTVGAPKVQAFVGALHGRRADRGAFITRSAFMMAALDYARAVPTRIVLIGGRRLGKLMVSYGCGVRDSDRDQGNRRRLLRPHLASRTL